MVRGKTQLRRIENASSRQVTFSKRRSGLLKKAFELSVLCDAEVALIIFSARGNLYEFSSAGMQKTIERYERCSKNVQTNNTASEQYIQHLKHEAVDMVKKIEFLQNSKRKLMGEGLGSSSIEELQQIENQLEKSLRNIRAGKSQLVKEQIEQLKDKEKVLTEENTMLREKYGTQPRQPSTTQGEITDYCPINQNIAVETELFIGPPETLNLISDNFKGCQF